MESQNPFPPPSDFPPVYWAPPTRPFYPAGKRELIFGAAIAMCSIFLCNAIVYGGFHLGFAIGAVAVIVCSCWYLFACGYRLRPYSAVLLTISILIAAGFARSSDGFVKFVLLLFLLLAVNLSLCLICGQNRRWPGGVSALLDALRTCFYLGFGGMGSAARGLNEARKRAGTVGKKSGAALLGLVIAVPIAAVMIFLLMRADAAFEGLMDLLPESDWSEPLWSVVLGGFAAWVLYARGTGLHHAVKPAPAAISRRGMSPITINMILGAICLVYAAYLLSQLAYLSGGLSGILPEDYTLAQYARRGFFEMAWLSAINLMLMFCAMGLVAKTDTPPRLTRLLCLMIGLVTLFLIAAASAKMFLYIGSFGLTRKRVLTEVIMVWLAITTVLVSVWLFRPKFSYMQGIVIAALLLGCITLWADVDTLVARYNVRSYQSGQLETIDMHHLSQLGCGAVPYIAELTGDSDPLVAEMAEDILLRRQYHIDDFRDWTQSEAAAAQFLREYKENQAASSYTATTEGGR